MIAGGENDPRMKVATHPRTLRPHDYGKRRVGQPRATWVAETVQFYCTKFNGTRRFDQAGTERSLTYAEERRQLIRAETQREARRRDLLREARES